MALSVNDASRDLARQSTPPRVDRPDRAQGNCWCGQRFRWGRVHRRCRRWPPHQPDKSVAAPATTPLTPGLSTCCDGCREHREAVQNPPYEGAGRGLRYDDSAVQRDRPAVRRVYLAGIGIIPEVRIEIARSHRVWRSKTVKVAIRPTVRLRDGYLDAHELALLTRWVDLNRDALCRLSELLTIRATECGKMCHERWRDPTVSSYCACITHFGSSLGRRADGVGLAV